MSCHSLHCETCFVYWKLRYAGEKRESQREQYFVTKQLKASPLPVTAIEKCCMWLTGKIDSSNQSGKVRHVLIGQKWAGGQSKI